MNRLIAIADEDGLALGFAEPREELAAEARHGGRYITEQLNSGWSQGHPDAETLRALQQKGDQDAVSRYWAFALSPSGGTGSGRDSTAKAAQRMARDGTRETFPKAKVLSLAEAQAMFDWPIYRAAFAPCTVCGFVGPREDHGSYGYEIEPHSYEPEPVYMGRLVSRA